MPIIEQLIESKFRKNDRLICIGGGITNDITAFIASIMFRGVEWLFFPTTLLAQADSCIGGKTSINIGNFKKPVGQFLSATKNICHSRVSKIIARVRFQIWYGGNVAFLPCLR